MSANKPKLNYQSRGHKATKHRMGIHLPTYRDTSEAPTEATRYGRRQGDPADLWLKDNDPRFKPRKYSEK